MTKIHRKVTLVHAILTAGLGAYCIYDGLYILAAVFFINSDFYMRYLKPQIEDLSQEELDLVTNGCGSESFRPIAAERYVCDCRHHDYDFARGGFLWSWFMANVWLLGRNIVTTFRQHYTKPWLIPAYLCINLYYFVVLMAVSWATFSFSLPWCWHSKDTIVKRALLRADKIPQYQPRASINEWVRFLLRKKQL